MTVIKAVAAVALAGLLVGLGWIVTHLTRIKRELRADEAMPKPSPRTNFLLLASVVVTALIGLMIYLLCA
jgi:hypothetical protein